MLTNELKVYKDTYQLSLLICQLVPKFPNAYKHSLGNGLCEEVVALFKPLQMANSIKGKEEKVKYLNEFMLIFENIKVRLRLVFDLKCISTAQYS